MNCLKCETHPAWSRGLCSGCYAEVYRSGELSLYPTKKFMDDPESHARWLFAMHPELAADIAVEYGYRVTEE